MLFAPNCWLRQATRLKQGLLGVLLLFPGQQIGGGWEEQWLVHTQLQEQRELGLHFPNLGNYHKTWHLLTDDLFEATPNQYIWRECITSVLGPV